MTSPLWIVLPVPPEIKIKVTNTPKDDRKKLDAYVRDFVRPHGYQITISHSSNDNGGLCHYDCHRSGNPARPKPKPIDSNTPPFTTEIQKPYVTRSIKIRCPFRLTGKLDEKTNTWELHHVRVGHNHGPADQTPVSVPALVYTQEIKSRTTRILQLSPRRQIIVLQELDKLIEQHSAIPLVTSPPMVDEGDIDDDEVALAMKVLKDLDERRSIPSEEDIPGYQAHLSQEDSLDSLVDQAGKLDQEHPVDLAAQQDGGILTDRLENEILPQAQAEVVQVEAGKGNAIDANCLPKELLIQKDKPDENPVGQVETDTCKEKEPVDNFKKKTRTKRASSSTTSKERPSRSKNQKLVDSNDSRTQANLIPAPRTTRSGSQKFTPAARSTRRITSKKA